MDYSKDIKLEADGAVYYFKFLEWDTDFFGKKSYSLDLERFRMKPSGKIERLFSRVFQSSFVTAKVNPLCGKETLSFLQKLGFKYIDTEVVLKYHPSGVCEKKTDVLHKKVQVLEVRNNKGLPYEKLGASFSRTRFHGDTNIPDQKANALWVNYIKNYKLTPLNHMFIARVGSKIGGAILVQESASGKEAVLLFVAVLAEFRNMGVGSRLIRRVAERFKDAALLIGTQISNTGAINFYIQNGFSKIDNVKSILHRW